ncbi:MAG: hypothetical protein EHM33_34270 [Chloroflexi bacterium]|nr:MAG: hypothetical protein EHM33_34270 [Chloroflexota bacterium]
MDSIIASAFQLTRKHTIMTRSIDNTDNFLDSRDIIARIEDLQSDLDSYLEAIRDADLEDNPAEARSEPIAALFEWLGVSVPAEDEEFDPDAFTLSEHVTAGMGNEAEELLALQNLADEAEGCADWQYGETLIHEDYFTDYARELASDCCDMKNANTWPFNCIDWDHAAKELTHDYCEVEFAGETYLIRA